MLNGDKPASKPTRGSEDPAWVASHLGLREPLAAMSGSAMPLAKQTALVKAIWKTTPPRFDAVEKDTIYAAYYANVIAESQGSKGSTSRFDSCQSLMALFMALWAEHRAKNKRALEVVSYIRSKIEGLCLRDDPEVTNSVLLVMLEHMFQNVDVSNYFSDWERQRKLQR